MVSPEAFKALRLGLQDHEREISRTPSTSVSASDEDGSHVKVDKAKAKVQAKKVGRRDPFLMHWTTHLRQSVWCFEEIVRCPQPLSAARALHAASRLVSPRRPRMPRCFFPGQPPHPLNVAGLCVVHAMPPGRQNGAGPVEHGTGSRPVRPAFLTRASLPGQEGEEGSKGSKDGRGFGHQLTPQQVIQIFNLRPKPSSDG